MNLDRDVAAWLNLSNGNSLSPNFEYVKREAQLEFVELYISDKCQLSCKHCLVDEIYAVDPELSVEEWNSVIDQFVELGVRRFHIAGREPFYGDKTLEVMKHLKSLKSEVPLRYGVITNGLTLSQRINQIKALDPDYLDISVDGMQAGHEFLRGKNTFERTTKGVRIALEQLGRSKIYISTVIHKQNLTEICAMIDYLSDFGINKFFLQPFLPLGKAGRVAELEPSIEEYDAIVHDVAENLLSSPDKRIGVIIYAHTNLVSGLLEHNELAIECMKQQIAGEQPMKFFGKSVIKFRLDFMPGFFRKNCVITTDGYYIASCIPRSSPNYIDMSVGSVRTDTVEKLFHRSLSDDVLSTGLIPYIVSDLPIMTELLRNSSVRRVSV